MKSDTAIYRILFLLGLLACPLMGHSKNIAWSADLKYREVLLQIERQRQAVLRPVDWPFLQWYSVRESQRQAVRRMQLNRLIQHWLDTPEPEHWAGWHQQLRSWQQRIAHAFIGRLPGRMDPEWLVAKPALNLLARQGERVLLCDRPRWLELWGRDLPTREDVHQISDYSQLNARIRRGPWHSQDWLWVVYPDGITERLGMAYWNAQNFRRLPGSRAWPEIQLPPEAAPAVSTAEFNDLLAEAIANLPLSDQCLEWQVTPSADLSLAP